MNSTELVETLEQAVPGFRAYFDSDENLFDSGTLHAVLIACSHFVRENEVEPASWKRLAELLNSWVDGTESELDNAAATCFLENLADRSHPLREHLRGKALEYWRHWE